MKTPRNFVVEIKSSRRSREKKSTSIWGDTDLQAIAREVKSASPHIFSNGPDPIASPIVTPVPTADGSPTSSIDVAVPRREHLETSSDQDMPGHPPTAGNAGGVESKATRKARVVNRPQRTKSTVVEAIPSSLLIDEELAELDRENSRLKLLLRQQLALENDRLRKMLDRLAK